MGVVAAARGSGPRRVTDFSASFLSKVVKAATSVMPPRLAMLAVLAMLASGLGEGWDACGQSEAWGDDPLAGGTAERRNRSLGFQLPNVCGGGRHAWGGDGS